jgi:hypothetical protein
LPLYLDTLDFGVVGHRELDPRRPGADRRLRTELAALHRLARIPASRGPTSALPRHAGEDWRGFLGGQGEQDHGVHVLVRARREHDPLGSASRREGGDEIGRGMLESLRSVHRAQRPRRAQVIGEELNQSRRVGVGPVEVIQHQHAGFVGHDAEQAQHALRECSGAGSSCASSPSRPTSEAQTTRVTHQAWPAQPPSCRPARRGP